jgi:hypothetical protein
MAAAAGVAVGAVAGFLAAARLPETVTLCAFSPDATAALEAALNDHRFACSATASSSSTRSFTKRSL